MAQTLRVVRRGKPADGPQHGDRPRRTSRADQGDLWAMARDRCFSPFGGANPRGWTAALNDLGVGPYELVSLPTSRGALTTAADAIRATERPVGLVMWRGRHAWVMTGFESSADPRAPTTSRSQGSASTIRSTRMAAASGATAPSPTAGVPGDPGEAVRAARHSAPGRPRRRLRATCYPAGRGCGLTRTCEHQIDGPRRPPFRIDGAIRRRHRSSCSTPASPTCAPGTPWRRSWSTAAIASSASTGAGSGGPRPRTSSSRPRRRRGRARRAGDRSGRPRRQLAGRPDRDRHRARGARPRSSPSSAVAAGLGGFDGARPRPRQPVRTDGRARGARRRPGCRRPSRELDLRVLGRRPGPAADRVPRRPSATSSATWTPPLGDPARARVCAASTPGRRAPRRAAQSVLLAVGCARPSGVGAGREHLRPLRNAPEATT